MRSTTLDGNRFVGEFVQFPFRKTLASDFPFIRLGRAAQEIDESVVPDFVSELRSIPVYFEKDDDTEIHEFAGVAAASVVTLDDTSGDLGQNEEIIAALAEDQEFEASACRSITIADVDYPIVSVDALTRAITVTGTPTAGAVTVTIYPFRHPTETGKVKLLKNDGLVLATAGASGRVAGLRTRDAMQGHQHRNNTLRGYAPGSTSQYHSFYGQLPSTALNDTGYAAEGTNGTPRTGANTKDRSLGVYQYMYAGRVFIS